MPVRPRVPGYPSRWPDARPAITLYEQVGWQLAGTQPATWKDPDGTTPTLCGYVRLHPCSRKEPG